MRGPNPDSEYAPTSGYRYDGLYYIDSYWQERGRSGFLIWRYRLVAENRVGDVEPPTVTSTPTQRVTTTVQRVVRNTELGTRVKKLHGYRCQVCGVALTSPAGLYAEAAHIRPLGRPHDGPDALENLLCLCPNHHVLFAYGAISLTDSLALIGAEGSLRAVRGHNVAIEYVRYHREHCAPNA